MEQIIRVYKPHIKEITLKNYVRNLHKILKDHNETEENLIKILMDFDSITASFSEHKLSVKQVFTATIVVYLEAIRADIVLIQKYQDYLTDIRLQQEELQGEKTKREEENWATLNDLKNITARLEARVKLEDIGKKTMITRKEKKLLQDYLVASLYTMLPPRRNIYASVKIILYPLFRSLVKSQLQENFLVINNDKKETMFFYFGNQKSKYFTAQTIKIKGKLKKIIKLYLQYHKEEYLLQNAKGEKLSKNGLTKLLNKIFRIDNRQISSSMIRKIYATETLGDAHNQILTNATAMGHLPATQSRYYVKKASKVGINIGTTDPLYYVKHKE